MTTNFINRYVWVYICWDEVKEEGDLNLFVSPDQNGVHLDTIATPFAYVLTRNGIRYTLRCEVKIAEKTAIRIAGTLYDTEFEIKKVTARKRARR